MYDAPVEDGEIYQGTVKGFSYETGWGFIESPQTHAIYGKDIFLMKTSLGSLFVKKGDPVEFSVTQTPKGPAAADVRLLSGEQTFIGTIKSFNPQKGWGMIACKATEKEYGKDIFVLKTSLPNGVASPGEEVRFSVEPGKKGPEAKNVRPVGKQPAVQWMPYGAMATVHPQAQPLMMARAPQMQQMPQMPQMQKKQHPMDSTYMGVVKSFNPERGWGMIACMRTQQDFGKDMFFLRTSCPSGTVQAGDQVRFQVGLGQKGPEARNVVPAGPGAASMAPAPAWGPVAPMASVGGFGKGAMPRRPLGQAVGMGPRLLTGRMFQGAIKSFNADKGWGFIACEETFDVLGKDVFLHSKELGGQLPTPGTTVQFELVANGQNFQAQNVNFVRQTGRARFSPY